MLSSSLAFPLAPARRAVLADLLPAGTRAHLLARDAVLVAAGAGLTGVASQISVHTPISPVPFALSTAAVLLTGAALGSVRGMASMLFFVLAGSAGVPWFTNGSSGFHSASSGYLIGYILAAGLVGALAHRGADRHLLGTVPLMILGNLVLYVPGVLWLHHEVPGSWGATVHDGATVFLAGDAIKLAAVALVLPAAWKAVKLVRR